MNAKNNEASSGKQRLVSVNKITDINTLVVGEYYWLVNTRCSSGAAKRIGLLLQNGDEVPCFNGITKVDDKLLRRLDIYGPVPTIELPTDDNNKELIAKADCYFRVLNQLKTAYDKIEIDCYGEDDEGGLLDNEISKLEQTDEFVSDLTNAELTIISNHYESVGKYGRQYVIDNLIAEKF